MTVRRQSAEAMCSRDTHASLVLARPPQVLGALASVMMVWVITLNLLAEAIHRLIEPEPVNGKGEAWHGWMPQPKYLAAGKRVPHACPAAAPCCCLQGEHSDRVRRFNEIRPFCSNA